MAKVDLKGVHKVTVRGRIYWYAWRGGPRLMAEPGTAAFVEELQGAHAARKSGDPSRVSGVVTLFRASSEYAAFADTTKRNWARWLDRIHNHFGPLPIALFGRPQIRLDIRRWRDRYKDTPRSADYGMQVLSRVMSFAVAEGMIGLNPCFGIPNIYRVDRSELIWSDADLAAVYAEASPELIWAAKLAICTGLRESDLLKLSWSHVQGLGIEMRTGKSRGRKRALIPVYAELEALLAEIPKRSTRILTNTRSLPWKSGFGDSWRDAVERAGKRRPEVLDLHFHDLRGTAATFMFGAGLTVREIAEILAWSEDRVERLIDRYVKRDELLRDRIRRLDAAKAGTPFVKPAVKPASA